MITKRPSLDARSFVIGAIAVVCMLVMIWVAVDWVNQKVKIHDQRIADKVIQTIADHQTNYTVILKNNGTENVQQPYSLCFYLESGIQSVAIFNITKDCHELNLYNAVDINNLLMQVGGKK